MKIPAFFAIALAMSVSAFSQTSAPAAPTLTAGAELKGLRFDWAQVAGATWYQLEYRAHQTGAFFSGDGHTLVIGDHLDNGRGFGPRAAPLLSGTDPTGGAYVYRLTDQWRLANMVKPNSQTYGFGNSLVLSQTGKTLVIALEGEASAANGIDGDWTNKDRPNSGALFMY